MNEKSLALLQKRVTQLEKENTRLRDKNVELLEEKNSYKKQIQYLKDSLEKTIIKAVNKALEKEKKENEKLRKENEKLKRILNNSSENSGLPSSKTPIGKEKRIPNFREKTNKNKGGQEGHKKHKLKKFKEEEITDRYIYEVERCTCGCHELIDLGIRTTKDMFDINIRLCKIQNEFHNYKCKSCGKVIESPVPLNLKEENQYGSHAQAMALSLVNEGYVSFHRTRKLISGFTNGEMNMSEGFISKLQKRSYEKLENFDNELHKKIIGLKVIHWDDTVINISKKQSCLRFYGDEKYAYYKAHEKKDKIGLDKDEILCVLEKDTVVVHDHNKVNYNQNYNFTNAECCVHLVRDLKKLNEVLPRNWIEKLIKLLIDTNNKRKDYINESIMYFDQEVTQKVSIEYDEILEVAREINRSDYNQYYGSEEKTLIKRLIDYKENYLLWIVRFDVPFSNNISERSLRSSKTKMKISGQFENIKNAEYYARIRSYIETCKRNSVNVYTALERLINDKPYTLEEIEKANEN